MKIKKLLSIVLSIAMILGLALTNNISAYASVLGESVTEHVYYVSANGNDSTGDGAVNNPYATVSKAYEALVGANVDGTIALLTDITMASGNSATIVNTDKKILFTSAASDGTICNNEAGNMQNVHVINRGTFTESLIELERGEICFENIILDGGGEPHEFDRWGRVHGGYLLNMPAGKGESKCTFGVNTILRNNNNTGAGGAAYGGAVQVGQYSVYNPQLVFEKNARVEGNIAPRHGGAVTIYSGDLYLCDDVVFTNNGVTYNEIFAAIYGGYYGGGTILAHDNGRVHMSGNAMITGNFVAMSLISPGVNSTCAVQIENACSLSIKDNAKIFDNFTKNVPDVEDNTQSNLYDCSGGRNIIIEGALGETSKIGITASSVYSGQMVATGTTAYKLTESDADCFFDDTLGNTIIIKDNSLVLYNSLKALLVDSYMLSSENFKLKLRVGMDITKKEVSLFLNGAKLDSSKYELASDAENKTLSIRFIEPIEVDDQVGIQINKNGYRFNEGKIYKQTNNHVHSWKYSADKNKLEAYCSAVGCEYYAGSYESAKADNNLISIALSATSREFSNTPLTCVDGTLEGDIKIDGLDEWTKKIGAPIVKYYGKAGSNTADPANNAAPIDAGKYTVKVCPSDSKASDVVATIDIEITKSTPKAPEAGVGYTVDYFGETLIADNYYEVSSTNKTAATALANDTVKPGGTYYVRTKENVNSYPSAWTTITVAKRPNAPTGYTVTNPSKKGGNDGKIAGLSKAMEYSIDNGDSWFNISSKGIVEGLKAGIVLVRVKATETAFSSEVASISLADPHEHKIDVNKKHEAVEGTCVQKATAEWYGCKDSACSVMLDKAGNVLTSVEGDFNPSKHVEIKTNTTKATLTANGKIVKSCTACQKVTSSKIVYCPQTYTLEKTKYEYTGSQIKPSIVIKDSKGNTISSTYYTVTYGTNKAVGKGTVEITFKGAYSGNNTVEFQIVPKKTVIATPSIATNGITVKWSKNTSAKGYIIYRRVGSGSYEKVKTITDNTVVSWKDSKANVNGTRYQYKIVSYKVVGGVNYKSGSSAVATRYFMSRPTITSLTNGAAGKMTTKWVANKKATGYQIQYSTDSSFATYKSSNVTSKDTVSRTFSSLTKGKKYYVRIRTYKTVGDTKYYSAWSDKKSITIAK